MGWLAAVAEFGGGILVAVGLLARIWALGLVVVMAVAIGVVHGAHGFDIRKERFEPFQKCSPAGIAEPDPDDGRAIPGFLPSLREIFVLGQDGHSVAEGMFPHWRIRSGMESDIHHMLRRVAK